MAIKQIITCGGGLFGKSVNYIFEYIAKASGKKNPNISIVCSASGYDPDKPNKLAEKVKFVEKQFSKFSKNVSVLSVHYLQEQIEDYLAEQDVIYVMGGSTICLLALCRAYGLDTLFKKAYQNGTLLAGESAGSICWFEEGVTEKFPDKFETIKAFGLLKGSFVPHYSDNKKRRATYHQFLAKKKVKPGFGVDEQTVLHFVEGRPVHTFSITGKAKAYKVSAVKGKIVESALD
jgi:peptidase E